MLDIRTDRAQNQKVPIPRLRKTSPLRTLKTAGSTVESLQVNHTTGKRANKEPCSHLCSTLCYKLRSGNSGYMECLFMQKIDPLMKAVYLLSVLYSTVWLASRKHTSSLGCKVIFFPPILDCHSLQNSMYRIWHPWKMVTLFIK